MRTVTCLILLALASSFVAGEPKFDPAARARALAPLIEEETIGLVRIDFSRTDPQGFSKVLLSLLPGQKDEVAELTGQVQAFQAAFVKAGGTELILSISTEDLPALSLVYVPLKDRADAEALTRLLKKHLPAGTIVRKQGEALVAGPREALDRFARGKPSARAELTAAVKAAGDTAVQVLFLPTPDQRRVIDEVVMLPIPGGSGRVLTRGARWAALGLDLGTRPRARLTLQSADAAAAGKLAEVIAAGVALVGKRKFLGEEKTLRELRPKEFATAARALKPAITGSQLTLEIGTPETLRALAALADTYDEHTGGVERSTPGLNLKQIVLALYGYNDTTGTLPPHAIYSKDGKPLLSWRVALLPYLDNGKLYEQFKLDEPWDSPHNKKLIPRMPKVYRSPKIRDRRPGLTTYLAPINKDFVFTGGKEGLRVPRDIPDGTALTAVVVDVNDETGVIWTRPDDLVVSKKDPWKGLLGHYPGYVLMGMADGSVWRVPKTARGETLWALFTRAGGEVIPDLSR
jgi:hypothetical protein